MGQVVNRLTATGRNAWRRANATKCWCWAKQRTMPIADPLHFTAALLKNNR